MPKCTVRCHVIPWFIIPLSSKKKRKSWIQCNVGRTSRWVSGDIPPKGVKRLSDDLTYLKYPPALWSSDIYTIYKVTRRHDCGVGKERFFVRFNTICLNIEHQLIHPVFTCLSWWCERSKRSLYVNRLITHTVWPPWTPREPGTTWWLSISVDTAHSSFTLELTQLPQINNK